jgi:signal transduction histidine kinase
VGWFVSGRILRPLRSLRRTAAGIGEDDLTTRIDARGTDEVSDLSRAFNAMLDRLQRSFDAQRRLLDDVSHELRTPITIVRGHLELLDPADPADVTDTRELAIDELDRMNVLVDDIALLVKTSRPDVLERLPVDVAELTEQVLARRGGARRGGLRPRTLDRVGHRRGARRPGVRAQYGWGGCARGDRAAVRYGGGTGCRAFW